MSVLVFQSLTPRCATMVQEAAAEQGIEVSTERLPVRLEWLRRTTEPW